MRLNTASSLSALILYVFCSSTNSSLATDFDGVLPMHNASEIDADTSAALMRNIGQTDLSSEAKHIQVNIRNGSTILRGAVKDDREKQTISNLAEQSGCPNIKNELTVLSASGQSASNTQQSKVQKPLIIDKTK